MQEAAHHEIRIGDYVKLSSRESPFDYPADWLWRVVNITDFGLDCVHALDRGGSVVRQGVSPSAVRT